MKIACTGPARRLEELRTKISSANEIQILEFPTAVEMSLQTADLFLDAGFDVEKQNLLTYPSFNAPLLVSANRLHLKRFAADNRWQPENPVMGWCASPTLINRSLWELTDPWKQADSILPLLQKMHIESRIVEDFPGMTGARVIAMIVNEAWLTFQEGTASKEDIDIAMKLGTNYPQGPFEWGEAMGLEEVVAILDSLMHETGDSRYQVSRMLRKASIA